MFTREKTKTVMIKNLPLGGNNKIYIQSMTTTKTKDIKNTINQIKELEKYGCEIIRVAVLDELDAYSISKIVKEINIPLVADIHFDYKLAIIAIQQGASKIRLNPGNIKEKEKIIEVVKVAKEYKVPIRIGVNGGSLPNDLPKTKEGIIEACKRHIKILEDLDFHDIVISVKTSDINLSKEAYKLASETFNYPLHVGITEAGTDFSGLIKSSIGISQILNMQIGNTIRVSLTANPVEEIKACKEILKNLGLINNVPTLISCPTCGRCQYDMMRLAKQVEELLFTLKKEIKVAVMGCVVNGPGEAKDANVAICGGKNCALLIKDNEIIKKIPEDEILNVLKEEIIKY